MAGLTDAEAICAAGSDPNAFALIFERHFDAVHGYLCRRIGDLLADDLTAETFARAFDRRTRYDVEQESARPWLFGIATNLLRGHYRREERQLRAYARTGLDPIGAPETEAIIDRVDAETEGPRLAAALADLDRRERDVLLLFAWADLSYSEIADALEVPIGTVRSRLHRARARVRDRFGQDCNVYPDPLASVGPEVCHG